MTKFTTIRLPLKPTAIAPDGSEVRVLLALKSGSVAHFQLAPGQVATAVAHRTVEEIWYVVAGKGQMWRKQDALEETVDLEAGVCLTIPVGTHFQFRAAETNQLAVIGVTMPPWPGHDEAFIVQGPWSPRSGQH